MSDKFMPPREFYQLGYLQELNRQFLHPLALAMQIDTEDERDQLVILDGREEADGLAFDHFALEQINRAVFIDQQQAIRHPIRYARLGYVRQPIVGETDEREKVVVDAELFRAMDEVIELVRKYDDNTRDVRATLDRIARLSA